MDHAPFRLLRTSLVGATILGLAAGAHLLGGGTLPAPGIMVGILALHVLCSTIVTKFKLSLPAMAGLLGSSQIVLHQAFDALSHGAHSTGLPASAVAGHHGMTAEAHAASLLAAAAPLADPATASLVHAAGMSGWMWAAHIAATLAAAGLLAYGESALWALANWLRPLYQSAAVILVIPAQNTRTGIVPRPLPRLPWRNLRPDTRRGPPALAAIFA